MPEYIVQIEDSEKNMSERFVGQLRSYPELVRCKECKHSEECLQGVVIDDTYVPTEWCSQGERKTE
jgi:hypothetical protein